MRRSVVILPDWLSRPEHPSFLRASLPGLEWLAERSSIRKCVFPNEPPTNKERGQTTQTPEAAWLGLDPSTLALQDGPLTVSALGADPPANSVHFHLSLLSLSEDKVSIPTTRLKDEEAQSILEASKKLNTKVLTIVQGEQFDHGLVWEEGSIELGTFTPQAVAGHQPKAFLPEGDGESILRRFIDDSLNLLSELEFNRQREEEGLAPLNFWWPWGQGFRVPVPNLALRRGEVAWVESNSMRLQGLSRLCGYRHGNRTTFGWGVRTNVQHVLETVRTRPSSVSVIDAFSTFRQHGRWEEAEWMTKELDERLFKPIADIAREESFNLAVLAPAGDLVNETAAKEGLALNFQTGSLATNTVPFDERALEERNLASTQDWQMVGEVLGA